MPGIVSIAEAPTTGLGKLLIENRFFVPTHQRDYRWELEQAQKLFDDIIEAMERPDDFYFVGLMVFMRSEDGRLRVLDGQQRLATTVIILSALRAWYGAAGSQIIANQIQTDFIGRAEYGEEQPLPKLTLNFNNDDRFQRYVVLGSSLPTIVAERDGLNKNAPNYRLLDAIIYCHNRVNEIAKNHASHPKTDKYFANLLKYIRDSVIVVRLTVPNEANAFRVFETLNDRGLDLSAVDLLKNHLFGLAHDKSLELLRQMESRWAQITQELQNVKEEEFLRVFWTSRNGRTQLEQIFDDVQKQYKTADKANDLSIDLLEASEQYAALESADDAVWSPHPPAVREFISTLRVLGSKQVRSIILSALKRFDSSELSSLLRLLEVIVVRWQMIGEERTGVLEINCAKTAHLIWQNKITTAQEAREALEAAYLPDDAFQAKFSHKENLSNPKAVYVLKKIEEHERGNNLGPEARALGPTKTLTLEHILPSNPGPGWEREIQNDPKLAIECANRIGNLCLLTESRNREAARSGFDEKKAVYAQSDLYTTKTVAEAAEWNRQSIAHRQASLAKKAVAVWRF